MLSSMGSNVPNKELLAILLYLSDVFKIGMYKVLGILSKVCTKSRGIIPCAK